MKYKGITLHYRKNDNRWMAYPTINGTRIALYGKTQNKLKDKIDTYIAKPLLLTQKKDKYTLYEWLDFWYKTYKSKLKSEYQIRNCINHIKSNIKNKALNAYLPYELDSGLQKIKSTRMRKYTYDILKESLHKAKINRIIKEDMSVYIEKVTHIRKKGTALTKTQRKIFLEKLQFSEHKDLFLFLFYTGCRKHGALTLMYENINWTEQKILITETKSKNATRYIPLFKPLINIFKKHKNLKGKVFDISDRAYRKSFEDLNNLCGFQFSAKDLRTTFGTMLAENGVSDNMIAKLMGHGNTSTTKQYYIMLLSDEENVQIDKINKIFKPISDNNSDNDF